MGQYIIPRRIKSITNLLLTADMLVKLYEHGEPFFTSRSNEELERMMHIILNMLFIPFQLHKNDYADICNGVKTIRVNPLWNSHGYTVYVMPFTESYRYYTPKDLLKLLVTDQDIQSQIRYFYDRLQKESAKDIINLF